jgi:hypothetical protein
MRRFRFSFTDDPEGVILSRSALFDVHLFTLFEGCSRSGSRALLEGGGTGTGTAEGLAGCGSGEPSRAAL